MESGAAGRVLVIGRAGQLARELARAVWPAGLDVRCHGRESVDLTDAAAVRALTAAVRPVLIVNAAAYTAVDRAETDAAAAFALNRDGPAHLAAAAASLGVPLIHVSTDYVFSGDKAGAYREDDPVGPLNVYGASKEAGEQAVRAGWPNHVILRTSWVYASQGGNFVRTMLRLGQERPELAVVADQTGCPTSAADLARAVAAIAGRLLAGEGGFGTFHCCGSGATSWHDLAAAVFAAAAARGRAVPRLRPIPTSAYPTPARRPRNSVLDTARLARVHGVVLRPWPEALGDCLDELLSGPPDPGAP